LYLREISSAEWTRETQQLDQEQDENKRVGAFLSHTRTIGKGKKKVGGSMNEKRWLLIMIFFFGGEQVILIYHIIQNSYYWHVIWQVTIHKNLILGISLEVGKNDQKKRVVVLAKARLKILVAR
jgi:hypothetical protein